MVFHYHILVGSYLHFNSLHWKWIRIWFLRCSNLMTQSLKWMIIQIQNNLLIENSICLKFQLINTLSGFRIWMLLGMELLQIALSNIKVSKGISQITATESLNISIAFSIKVYVRLNFLEFSLFYSFLVFQMKVFSMYISLKETWRSVEFY